jgi:hypothetical protein
VVVVNIHNAASIQTLTAVSHNNVDVFRINELAKLGIDGGE